MFPKAPCWLPRKHMQWEGWMMTGWPVWTWSPTSTIPAHRLGSTDISPQIFLILAITLAKCNLEDLIAIFGGKIFAKLKIAIFWGSGGADRFFSNFFLLKSDFIRVRTCMEIYIFLKFTPTRKPSYGLKWENAIFRLKMAEIIYFWGEKISKKHKKISKRNIGSRVSSLQYQVSVSFSRLESRVV